MAGIVPGPLGRIFEAPLKDSDVSELSASLSNGVDSAVVAQVAEVLRRFSVLVEVSKTIAKSVSLDGMLPHSIEVIVEVPHADRAILFLHDGQAREDGVWAWRRDSTAALGSRRQDAGALHQTASREIAGIHQGRTHQLRGGS